MTESLAKVYEDYKADPAFRALAMRSRFVPAKGSNAPLLILVGEAPGAEENEKGEPFVGASGKVIDKLLDYADIQREAVFITNVVKYRPPDNRTPTAKEIAAARPYMKRELAIVGRKQSGVRPIVCLLGKTAGHLLGNHTHKQGDIWTDKGWRFAYLYHPAVALYDPNMLDTLKQQFRNVRNEAVKIDNNKKQVKK